MTLKLAIFTTFDLRDLDLDLGSGHAANRRVCASSRPLSTYQILFEIGKKFVDGH